MMKTIDDLLQQDASDVLTDFETSFDKLSATLEDVEMTDEHEMDVAEVTEALQAAGVDRRTAAIIAGAE